MVIKCLGQHGLFRNTLNVVSFRHVSTLASFTGNSGVEHCNKIRVSYYCPDITERVISPDPLIPHPVCRTHSVLLLTPLGTVDGSTTGGEGTGKMRTGSGTFCNF